MYTNVYGTNFVQVCKYITSVGTERNVTYTSLLGNKYYCIVN